MKRFLYIALVFALCVSCKDEVDPYSSDWGKSTITKIDITNAKMLVLTGNDLQSKATADNLGFYKLDEEGNLEAVYTYVMEDGKEVKSKVLLVPQSIFPLSKEYVLLSRCAAQFEDGTQRLWGLSYIVRKNDGAIFYTDDPILNKIRTYEEIDYQENSDILPRTDQNGYTYFIAGNEENDDVIYKMGLNRISNGLEIQQVSLDQFILRHGTTGTFRLHPFEIDPKGNCITTSEVHYENSYKDKVILYKADGGIFEFPESAGVFEYFIGYDGQMYGWSALGDSYPYTYKVFPIEIGTDVTYDLENAPTLTSDMPLADLCISYPYTLENNYIHILFSIEKTETQNKMLVYNSKENTLKEIVCLEGKMSTAIGHSRNSIYRIMGNQIYEYNFDSNQERLIPIDYDLNSCTAYKSWQVYNAEAGGKFILCAVRNSDQALLRIEVDMATGKTTTFEDPQEQRIISLVQVG